MTKATRPGLMGRIFAALVTVLFTTTIQAQGIVSPADVQWSDNYSVEDPLNLAEPDPFRGLEIFVNRKLGNCVACHSNFDVAAMQFLGDIGPNLDWIGDRLTEGELRAIVVDSKAVLGEQTIMPAFYTSREGFRTLESFRGKTILTAQQVEDVVAYLSSLSREASFDGVD